MEGPAAPRGQDLEQSGMVVTREGPPRLVLGSVDALERQNSRMSIPLGLARPQQDDSHQLLPTALRTGEVVEVLAAPGSSASFDLCAQLVLSLLSRCGHTAAAAAGADSHGDVPVQVLWVDTCLGFSAERLYSLARERFVGQFSREQLKRVLLDKVQVLRVHTLADLVQVFSGLDFELSGEAFNFKLVVVDSMFGLLASESGEARSLSGAYVSRLQLQLRRLCSTYDLAVLLTNVDRLSVGGLAWQSTAHVRWVVEVGPLGKLEVRIHTPGQRTGQDQLADHAHGS